MKDKIVKVHQVIADLDEEMNWLRDTGSVGGPITVEGHKKMIASLDEFCVSVGFPCSSFEDLDVKCSGKEDESFVHRLFEQAMDVSGIDRADLDMLELEMVDAGLALWKEDGQDDGLFFDDTDKYPILLFDNVDWTLATRVRVGKDCEEMVDIQTFRETMKSFVDNRK